MRSVLAFATAFWLSLCLAQPASAQSDAGAHVLALDNSWNRALETTDTKALDMLLADNFVSIDIDGSMQTKREFLASLKSTGYHASRAFSRHLGQPERHLEMRRLRRRADPFSLIRLTAASCNPIR